MHFSCFDVSCPENFNIHFIRMEDFEISPDKDVIMDGLSAEECKQSCIVSLIWFIIKEFFDVKTLEIY